MTSSTFRCRRDIIADTVIASDIGGPITEFDLTFTGPFEKTVRAKLSHVNNIYSLYIPLFSDTAGSSVSAFVAHPPEWLPMPPISAAISCPITNDGDTAAGYVCLVRNEGGVILIIPLPRVNYTGVCGLENDVVLQYAV